MSRDTRKHPQTIQLPPKARFDLLSRVNKKFFALVIKISIVKIGHPQSKVIFILSNKSLKYITFNNSISILKGKSLIFPWLMLFKSYFYFSFQENLIPKDSSLEAQSVKQRSLAINFK